MQLVSGLGRAFIILAGVQIASKAKTSVPELLCPRLVLMRFLPEPYFLSGLTGFPSSLLYWPPVLYVQPYLSQK